MVVRCIGARKCRRNVINHIVDLLSSVCSSFCNVCIALLSQPFHTAFLSTFFLLLSQRCLGGAAESQWPGRCKMKVRPSRVSNQGEKGGEVSRVSMVDEWNEQGDCGRRLSEQG
jgi:hypothetical protein